MARYVFDFAEGNRDMSELLGGKGANLAEMTNLGLPVPPGFTITTAACGAYSSDGSEPSGLLVELQQHVARLERQMSRRLGDPRKPLLVSIRSGGKYSMPGMMETILNVGLNDISVAGLADESGDERFAWDSYRRLIQMYGKTVMGVDAAIFEAIINSRKRQRGIKLDTELQAADWRDVVAQFLVSIEQATHQQFPQDPLEQLRAAVRAVFRSSDSARAKLYRRKEALPAQSGTAVNVMAMVFGNLGEDSGTGVAFTRDPSTGQRGVYGDYLVNAQGEDVVAGIRNTVPLADLADHDKHSYDELLRHMSTLECHFRDLCDIEFTVERGKLWMLQTRVGKRTPAAAFVIASSLLSEGVIDESEALTRVHGVQLSQLMFPAFDKNAVRTLLAQGIGASPGAASGEVVFDSASAVSSARSGRAVVLVRNETNPDDLSGMIAAQGVLTSRGGKTSHAAVVARGMGKTCVCGAEELHVDTENRTITTPDGRTVKEGDVVSIDGSSGEVFLGQVSVTASPVVEYFEGTPLTDAPESAELVNAVDRLMKIADSYRRLEVRANADTPEDVARAGRFGAEGVGLCRTEHMFLGDRRIHVEHLILAESASERQHALTTLETLQRADFEQILAAMDGRPVTIRMIDPPLHEFLPDITELAVRVEHSRTTGVTDERSERLLLAVERMHEENPMLGLRGVRLALVTPGLLAMQVRAIARAAAALRARGHDPRPEIMLPLVASVNELRLVTAEVQAILRAVGSETGEDLSCPIGTMIELPRAALTARKLAEVADFFSFGTNDLTQTTWGFSRDDAETAFFGRYLELGIFDVSPFETLDLDGVGALIQLAVDEGRRGRPNLGLGVCGEHAGDPSSIDFFHHAGLDYVSCSPFRLPIARLEAGRAAVIDRATTGEPQTSVRARAVSETNHAVRRIL
jgi:pyruvate,orthophosphate dikinase